jgi:outer membrane protein OmpA-like peptidoglycan-associated protein
MRLMLAVALMALPPAAMAQVTTNSQALDSLKAAPAPDGKAAAPPKQTATPPHARHTATRAAHTLAPTKAPQKSPFVPPAPPANPVIAPPPLMMPVHPPPPPPPVPLRADAQGQALPLTDGARITFAPGGSTLNPATFAAILAIAEQAKANPAMTVGVTAWAPGTADDPSTPRRLSLDRALAARAVLIANGIVSERIRTIAKGMNDLGSTAPADRVDITRILPSPDKKPVLQTK